MHAVNNNNNNNTMLDLGWEPFMRPRTLPLCSGLSWLETGTEVWPITARQSPFKRAATKHSYIWRQFAPHRPARPRRAELCWENTAPNTFWLNSTICRARGIEERHGSKLKSLSCYMFWCWKTIFLMQWRTFVTLWCFHDTHVSNSIRRVNICYNYLKFVLTFSTKIFILFNKWW